MDDRDRVPEPRPVPPSRWALAEPRPGDPELVGMGADLAPATLVDAYRKGIFPWPHEGMELPWFCPDPRAVIEPGALHVSRSLARQMRRCGWVTTLDADFVGVVEGCARRPRPEGTWITPQMARAYTGLAELGWAHSVEVWDGGELVGGIYGVAVGGCLTGESMFHTASGASKVALADLAQRWFEAGGALLDVQLPTPHLESMGAVAVPRESFLDRLHQVRDAVVRPAAGPSPVSRLAQAG